MALMKLYLVRHGETDWNVERRAQGFSDVALNEVGRRQAQALADAFRRVPLTAVYASDLRRAVETAQAIAAPHGLPVRTDPDLREINQGDFEGVLLSDLRANHGPWMEEWRMRPGELSMPDGESLAQVQERAWAAVERIVAAHPDGPVVAVSHALALTTILCRALAMDLDDFRRLRQDVAAINAVEFGAGQPCVALLNDTCHLR